MKKKYLFSMQLFSADTVIFSKKFFFEKNPNQPRIDFSCYKYVPRRICSLICGNCPLVPLALPVPPALGWDICEEHNLMNVSLFLDELVYTL